MSILDAQIADDTKAKPKEEAKTLRPHCHICGRFMKRTTELRYGWKCPKVFYDDYMGAWEHD